MAPAPPIDQIEQLREVIIRLADALGIPRHIIRRMFRKLSTRPSELSDQIYDDPEFKNLFDTLSELSRDRKIAAQSELNLWESSKLSHWYAPRASSALLDLQLDLVRSNLDEVRADAHQWLSAQSAGLDLSLIKLPRFLPLRVYLASGSTEQIDSISTALDAVATEFGIQITDEFPAERGSWFKKWWAKVNTPETQAEFTERIRKLERALEMANIGAVQADIDEKQARAVASLIEAIKNEPAAAIQAGSILLVKVTRDGGSVIQVRTLTQKELIYLENNQRLLASPSNILEELNNICRADGASAALDSKEVKTQSSQKRMELNVDFGGTSPKLPPPAGRGPG